jgi:hypothetical protein
MFMHSAFNAAAFGFLFPQLDAYEPSEWQSRRDQEHPAFAAANINEAIVAEIVERKRIQYTSRGTWSSGDIVKICGIAGPAPSSLLG